MSERMQSRRGHVWRWKDEDPEAIVLLVIILAAIIALPWRGCGPLSAQGGAHSVLDAIRPQIEQLTEQQGRAEPTPAQAAPAQDDAYPTGDEHDAEP